ncbi:unnamed protein product [Rhizoctonia solani]|uniref:Uncharacterized protein n=1 Tax=Rhizoctonia solani TaxID=456999 RepID=A0A8H3HC99_9AGAM|nr:unnamed protein product [Rhizoctonia solani]
MIAAGMNALVRRSCTWNSVRTLATTAKPGGSGRNNWHGRNQFRKGGEQSKPQAGTKPEPKPVPSLKTQPKGEQSKSRAGTKPELKPAPPLKTNRAHKLEHASRKQESIPHKQGNAQRKAEHTSHKAGYAPQNNRPAQNPGQKSPKPKLTPVSTPVPTSTTSLEPPTTENEKEQGDTPQIPLSAYTLPAAQLRALIDLYHSSTSYITPETLSSAIDETFAPRRFRFSTSTRYQSYGDLIAQRDERDAEPDRVVPSANELSGRGYGAAESIGQMLSEGGWSESKDERARMVRAALWGVDPLAKIGLETLLEAKVEMDVQDREPKEKK